MLMSGATNLEKLFPSCFIEKGWRMISHFNTLKMVYIILGEFSLGQIVMGKGEGGLLEMGVTIT